jgi:hypothetical protein
VSIRLFVGAPKVRILLLLQLLLRLTLVSLPSCVLLRLNVILIFSLALLGRIQILTDILTGVSFDSSESSASWDDIALLGFSRIDLSSNSTASILAISSHTAGVQEEVLGLADG